MISFGRAITGDLETAVRREWLVTNGIGGFASGTIAGMNTRRYHGLLFAALAPPLGRILVLARLDEQVTLEGLIYPLATNEWASMTISPQGYRLLESFHLEGTVPVFTYALADALLQKRIWMAHGANTTYVTYCLVRSRKPVHLNLTPIGCCRDYHSHNLGPRARPDVRPAEQGARIQYPDAVPHWLKIDHGTFHPEPTWYWRFYHRLEAYRGLDANEDLFSPGFFSADLEPGEMLTFVVTLNDDTGLDGGAAFQAEKKRQSTLLARANFKSQPPWVEQLVVAADQFVVDRPGVASGNRSAGKSIIAGYHWFGDWGRDTMISLPGLTLSTGRAEVAAAILRTFARYVDQGMLPNRFPDAGETPEYNTVDASLWYFNAVYRLGSCLSDEGPAAENLIGADERNLVDELYPILADIIDWHQRGTRYGIKMDTQDALLYAGQPGVQLTWMDAKVNDWVVTPRQGKAVEINALWYNALRVMARFAQRLNKTSDAAKWRALGDRVAVSFRNRFWFPEGQYLLDVVDGPNGDDSALRPNQLLAVSLPNSPVSPEQARGVVDACAAGLLTSYGLRSLAPKNPNYVGQYGGDRLKRDGAYHQGAVWAWLIGPFVEAHLKVYGDVDAARSFLRAFEQQLSDHGIGTISEIFDGDPPHEPHGCIAQAWSVAEVLRVWLLVNEYAS
jgi:predicted glycogen debranching enzyme